MRVASCASLALSVFLGACASDRYLGADGHKFFRDRDFARAADAFAQSAKEPGTNQLLFMLDEASNLFAVGNYEKAIQIFLKAEDLAAIKDYTSISEEVGALATSGNVQGYKGEDFEKVLINAYLAMSFAAVGKIEDAQVEARKINLILYRMIHEGKRNYQESPFSRYISALMWEASGEINDAYIDYKKTYELDPKFPGIASDLIGTARKLHFNEDLRDWSEKFPNEPVRDIPRGSGELVVFFEKGLSPVKIPRDGDQSSLPRFVRRFSETSMGRVVVDGQALADTVMALDIESTEIRYLEDRIGRMFAAKLAGLAVKGALGYGVAKLTKNDDLGILAFYALALSDRADLRSWRSLPAQIQIARLPLRAGTYNIDFQVLGLSGQPMWIKSFGKIKITAGKKVFLTAR